MGEGARRADEGGANDLRQLLVYFTDPTATPRVSVRWKIKKKMIVGAMPSSDAAACSTGSERFCPRVSPIASVTVWLLLETSSTSGIRNSFQVQMKKNVPTSIIVGRITGTTTNQSVCQRFAPSISAASMISRGKLPSTDASRYVPKAPCSTVNTMMTASCVSYLPTAMV